MSRSKAADGDPKSGGDTDVFIIIIIKLLGTFLSKVFDLIQVLPVIFWEVINIK